MGRSLNADNHICVIMPACMVVAAQLQQHSQE